MAVQQSVKWTKGSRKRRVMLEIYAFQDGKLESVKSKIDMYRHPWLLVVVDFVNQSSLSSYGDLRIVNLLVGSKTLRAT